ncbi:MAG: 23S rRNA (uridine(2552)-2'-O)-methyltransferase [Halobacteria archaeon]|nr:23S rRNA (uridine(2552)-2'-O)-methyltransferase [Halobacteria archaeon]
MSVKDEYYRRASDEGYRARSAYKLRQMDDEVDLLEPDDVVVDLGAAPGGWVQVETERAGRVIGVDLRDVEEFDDDERGSEFEFVRGDITDDETRDEIAEKVGSADVVTSDASPDLSGDWNLDHSRSVHLARSALETAERVLAPGGDLLVKVFQGDTLDDFRDEVEGTFEHVRTLSPDASRDESSEVYILGRGYTDAPVEEGDVLTVEIEDTGDEGDGIARIDGYVLFVEEAEEGDEVRVEVNEVMSKYAFCERSDNA